jgi:hypothetical protein
MGIKMREKFVELGYHVGRNLINPEVIEDVRQEIIDVFSFYAKIKINDQAIMELFSKDFEGFHGCAQVCQNLISLNNLGCSECITETLKELGIRHPTINTRPLVSFSSAKTAKNSSYWKTPPHQDWPSCQGSINGMTVWVPLVNIDSPIGPLEVIPRSHLFGYLEHGDKDVPFLTDVQQSEFLPIPMQVGDVLFFNTFTIHRSGENVTDKIRLTTHFRYNDAREPTFIERKYPHHRIDCRKEGILYPGFPSINKLNEILHL